MVYGKDGRTWAATGDDHWGSWGRIERRRCMKVFGRRGKGTRAGYLFALITSTTYYSEYYLYYRVTTLQGQNVIMCIF